MYYKKSCHAPKWYLQLFLRYYKFDLVIRRPGSWVGAHTVIIILSIHINFTSYQSVHPFLKYDCFIIWPWKSNNSMLSHCLGQSARLRRRSNIVSDSYSFFPQYFRSTISIGHPISDIRLFQNLTLEVHAQGHSSRPQRRYFIISTRSSFAPCQSILAFLRYSIFDFYLKILGHDRRRGHN